MKRILYALLPAVALLMAACDKYDDSELRGEMNDIRSRVENLEALCSKINGNVKHFAPDDPDELGLRIILLKMEPPKGPFL